jgi:hypothetical protein
MVKVLQVTKALDSGGGGGGGGGDACGPAVKPAGLRAIRAGESIAGPVTPPGDSYTFTADSLTAIARRLNGFPTSPMALEVSAFDCDKRAAFHFSLPYPPPTGVDIFSGVPDFAVTAGFQTDFDGLTQIFPGVNSVKVRIDTFNQATKSISGHVTIDGYVNDVAFTLEDWQGD